MTTLSDALDYLHAHGVAEYYIDNWKEQALTSIIGTTDDIPHTPNQELEICAYIMGQFSQYMNMKSSNLTPEYDDIVAGTVYRVSSVLPVEGSNIEVMDDSYVPIHRHVSEMLSIVEYCNIMNEPESTYTYDVALKFLQYAFGADKVPDLHTPLDYHVVSHISCVDSDRELNLLMLKYNRSDLADILNSHIGDFIEDSMVYDDVHTLSADVVIESLNNDAG